MLKGNAFESTKYILKRYMSQLVCIRLTYPMTNGCNYYCRAPIFTPNSSPQHQTTTKLHVPPVKCVSIRNTSLCTPNPRLVITSCHILGLITPSFVSNYFGSILHSRRMYWSRDSFCILAHNCPSCSYQQI